jgi:hypothetical protein
LPFWVKAAVLALDLAVVPVDVVLHPLADVTTGVVQDQHEHLFAFSGELPRRQRNSPSLGKQLPEWQERSLSRANGPLYS